VNGKERCASARDRHWGWGIRDTIRGQLDVTHTLPHLSVRSKAQHGSKDCLHFLQGPLVVQVKGHGVAGQGQGHGLCTKKNG
jgi:hypothetical protein